MPEILPAHPDALAITRLVLERLPTLTADERTLFVDIVRLLTYPVVMVPARA